MDLEERQITAVTTGLVALIFVPVAILAALIFVAGWLWILGIPGGHGMLFGWLSTKDYNHAGQPQWGIARLPFIYLFGVISAYLGYQLSELLYGAFRTFQRALA